MRPEHNSCIADSIELTTRKLLTGASASGRSTHSMAEMLDAGSSDEVKLWLQQVHIALEKQPARELFAKFNRDTTVCIACMLVVPTSCSW